MKIKTAQCVLFLLTLTTLSTKGMFLRKANHINHMKKTLTNNSKRKCSYVPSSNFPGKLCLMDTEFTPEDLKGASYTIIHSRYHAKPFIIKYHPLSLEEIGFALAKKDGGYPYIFSQHIVGRSWTYKKVYMFNESDLLALIQK
jgi:hypothetical protein